MPGGRKSQSADLAAVALASGKTAAEAALAASVSERTIVDWKAKPEFKARVSELRSQMVSAAAGRLADGMTAAADVLRAMLDSATEGIKLRSADLLLGHAMKVVELAELQKRVEELEQRLGEKTP